MLQKLKTALTKQQNVSLTEKEVFLTIFFMLKMSKEKLHFLKDIIDFLYT